MRLSQIPRGNPTKEWLNTGLGRTALDDAIKRGDFPKPVKIGPRAVGWLEDDIAQWQRGMIAKRDAGE